MGESSDRNLYDLNFDEQIEKDNAKYAFDKMTIEIISEAVKPGSVETVTTSVQYANLAVKEANAPKRLEWDKNGVKVAGELTGVSYSEIHLPSQELELTKSVNYGWTEEKPSPPATIQTTYTDPLGKEVTANIPLNELVAVDAAQWIDDYTVSGSFPVSDLGYCVINGQKIVYTDTGADISAAVDEIMKMFNLDANRYKLNTAVWDNEPSFEKNGKMYRKCTIHGSRYVTNWRADYLGTVYVSTTAVRYNATAEYSAVMQTADQTQYEIRAIATYQLIPPITPAAPVSNAAPAVVVATAAVPMTGTGAIFMIFFFKRKNVLIREQGRVIYRTIVVKDQINLNKISKFDNLHGLVLEIRKSYTTKNIGKTVFLLANNEIVKKIEITVGKSLTFEL